MSLSLPPAMLPATGPERIMNSAGPESGDLSLRQAIRILRKRFRIILIAVGVMLGIVVLASLVLPHKYASTATVQLLNRYSDAAFSQDQSGGQESADELRTNLQTVLATLQDQQLAIETIERMKIEDLTYARGLPFWESEVIPADPAKRHPLAEDPVAREYLLKKFEDALDVRVVPDSRLIEVTYTDRDPKFAAAVTNAIVDQYFKDELGRNNASTAQATEWMGPQLEELKQRVEIAQKNLVDFQKKSGFIAVPGSASGTGAAGGSESPTLHSPLLDRMMALNQNLVQAQNNRITQEAILHVAQTQDPDAVAALISTLGSAPGAAAQMNDLTNLMNMRSQQSTLKQQLATASANFGPRNPHIQELNQQILFLGDQIKSENARILRSAASSTAMAQASENSLRNEVSKLEQQANGLNDSTVRLSVLQQEADSTRQLYENLYTKLQESRIAEVAQATSLIGISTALPAAKPKFPNWPLNIGIGIGGGLFFGILIAFLRDSLDETISHGKELEAIAGIPVLAQIPSFAKNTLQLASTNGATDPLSLSEPKTRLTAKPFSLPGEAYRSLRATLMLSQPGAPPKILLVSSALPGEGKTTTAYNLATCLAQSGKRVLAIDADMRKRSHQKRGEGASTKGLSTLLTSSDDPFDAIVPDGSTQNLFLLLAGPMPPNPTELLGSARFAEQLKKLRQDYDHIVIDSPPASFLADALLIAPLVDGVLATVRSGRSSKTTVLRFIESMRLSKANLIGFVLNDIDIKSSDFHEIYGYYGSGGYAKYATN